MVLSQILVVIHMLWSSYFAWPCETPTAEMKFQGTAFEHSSFRIEGNRVRFFKNSVRETEFKFDQQKRQWCYKARHALRSRPAQGCLSRALHNGKKAVAVNGKTLPQFSLRNEAGQLVGLINIYKNLLSANFVDAAGKATGKRIIFNNRAKEKALEVSAWNCPNPRFLTCTGSRLNSSSQNETVLNSEAIPLREAELSKTLGRYQLECGGLFEVQKTIETRKAKQIESYWSELK